jgi:hypothetical protein
VTYLVLTVLALLDFSKAFYMVNHLLFLHKLDWEYDFHTSARSMVSSFLQDRSMMVEVDGVKFSPRSLFSGVPQGCIPSPLIFSMFINDLCSSIHFAKFHFYADDLQIYLSGDSKDLSGIISALNDDLASISRGAAENCL